MATDLGKNRVSLFCLPCVELTLSLGMGIEEASLVCAGG